MWSEYHFLGWQRHIFQRSQPGVGEHTTACACIHNLHVVLLEQCRNTGLESLRPRRESGVSIHPSMKRPQLASVKSVRIASVHTPRRLDLSESQAGRFVDEACRCGMRTGSTPVKHCNIESRSVCDDIQHYKLDGSRLRADSHMTGGATTSWLTGFRQTILKKSRGLERIELPGHAGGVMIVGSGICDS